MYVSGATFVNSSESANFEFAQPPRKGKRIICDNFRFVIAHEEGETAFCQYDILKAFLVIVENDNVKSHWFFS